jgi:hypothetical protein
MKLVMARGGRRHLVADSAPEHTLCGRDCAAWEAAPEDRIRDVPVREYCVTCWRAVMSTSERFRDESWSDGSPVYPVDFGKGGYISPDEVRRIREAQNELQARERAGRRHVHPS